MKIFFFNPLKVVAVILNMNSNICSQVTITKNDKKKSISIMPRLYTEYQTYTNTAAWTNKIIKFINVNIIIQRGKFDMF